MLGCSHKTSSSQFSSVPWPTASLGRYEGCFSRDSPPVFSAGGPCEQFWHGQICPLFDVVHPAFPLPTTTSPTLKSALRNGFGEAVTTCDMSNACKFLSLVQSTNHYFIKLTSVYSLVYLLIASDDHLTIWYALSCSSCGCSNAEAVCYELFWGKKSSGQTWWGTLLTHSPSRKPTRAV